MGWHRVLECTTAVLHYSSHPEPIQWISSFFDLNGCKQRFGEGGWFHLLWFLCPLLMFTGRTSTQLNWGIIKQTHQTACLQSQSSQRKTLIKCVDSQTRWREDTQVYACVISDRNSVLGDERLGLAASSFIFSKKAVIEQQLWWTKRMRVLIPI